MEPKIKKIKRTQRKLMKARAHEKLLKIKKDKKTLDEEKKEIRKAKNGELMKKTI